MASAEIKRYWSKVASFGCVVSKAPRPTIHHVHGGSIARAGIMKGLALKTSDWLVIPLAAEYHTGDFGIDNIGVITWESMFGEQLDFLFIIEKFTGVDIWTKAGIKRPK